MQNSAVAIGLALLFALIITISQGVKTVPPGTVGVVTHFGSVQEEVIQPGLHFKVPIMTRIVEVDTRVQKVEEEATASSKDLQIVTSKIALNYRINSAEASTIYSELGLQYPHTIVQPALQETIKATTAQFTAEELITKRSDVANLMQQDIENRLADEHILPTDLSIIDFNFSREFNEAIEQKQVAQQAALRAQNELDRIRIEAEQAKAKAEGLAEAELARARAEAEAQKMLRETISSELLMLRAVEKWNGTLPVYMGGGSDSMPELFLTRPVGQ